MYLQLRSDWDPAVPACIIFNSDSSKLNIIVTLITDIILLLTVLIGLLRLRREVSGTLAFGIGRLLWKQVGQRPFSSTVVLSVQ